MVENLREERALLQSVERILSIRCENYKADYIRRRISSRMRIIGAVSFDDYHNFFLHDENEQDALRNALTINVTAFWRDPEVFDVLKKQILPDLMRSKRRIRIWSAGCATGEEAYTLALIVYDFTRLRPDVQVAIYATDLDQQVLNRAREGIYAPKSLKNLSKSQIFRHFTLRKDGNYEVRQHLRDMVRFRNHDLMTGIPISNYLDMILCRNVTIYFTERQKNDLARMIHGSLINGGYYIMGKTEFLGREVEGLFDPYDSLQKIYRKNPVGS